MLCWSNLDSCKLANYCGMGRLREIWADSFFDCRCVLFKMDWRNYMSPFLSFFVALIHFTLSEWTPEQCRDMGFSVNLLCSSCDELKPFNLTESSLEQNCRKCCHADGQDEVTKVWIKYVLLIAFSDDFYSFLFSTCLKTVSERFAYYAIHRLNWSVQFPFKVHLNLISTVAHIKRPQNPFLLFSWNFNMI